jgi:hypothetical protein
MMRIGIRRPYDLGCRDGAQTHALGLAAACDAWTGPQGPWPWLEQAPRVASAQQQDWDSEGGGG